MAAITFPERTTRGQFSDPDTKATTAGEWRTRPNASAGVEELRWYQQNRAQLRNYSNLWIAVSGARVVASGDSVDEVFAQIDALAVVDPLVVFVRPFPKTSRRIA